MRILETEITLREETRAEELARPAVAVDVHEKRCVELSSAQGGNSARVGDVTQKIRELEDGEMSFAREIAMLSRVKVVMTEAQMLLSQFNTGAPTIAAETEAIELLLQTQRANPQSGGGGGSTPGGGATGATDESALALVGSGAEREARPTMREVGQATGRSGTELPAEFRAGLDAFFEALERSREGGTATPAAR